MQDGRDPSRIARCIRFEKQREEDRETGKCTAVEKSAEQSAFTVDFCGSKPAEKCGECRGKERERTDQEVGVDLKIGNERCCERECGTNGYGDQ